MANFFDVYWNAFLMPYTTAPEGNDAHDSLRECEVCHGVMVLIQAIQKAQEPPGNDAA